MIDVRRIGLCLVLAMLGATCAPAAPLPKGESLLPMPFVNAASKPGGGKAAVGLVECSQPGYTTALRVKTLEQTPNFWDVQCTVGIDVAISEGDLMHVRFFARGGVPGGESGEARLQVYFQQNVADFNKELSMQVSVHDEWLQFDYPFVARHSYAPGESALCFGFGFGEQEVELCGVQLVRFGEDVKLEELPVTPVRYSGMAADAPWRAEAAARIEKYRKGDLTVLVTDAAGRPVPDATVVVDMTRHEFQFASVVQAWRVIDPAPENETYRRKLLELFNASGTENALKWPPWDGEWDQKRFGRETAIAALKWLKDHGLYVRGHVMVWPNWNHLPKRVTQLDRSGDAVLEAIRRHIADIGGATRAYVDEWDVLNEPRTNHHLMDLYGRRIMADWFRYARAAHPNAGLFINEFNIVSAGNVGSPEQIAYRKTIQGLLDQRAPITGIGFQAHFGGQLQNPGKVFLILDSFADLGLDLRITEFDISIMDEEVQAAYTRDFMTAVFSHPKVVGLQMWGFWENAHWRSPAAMYRADWQEKLNGAAYRRLVFKDWWTREKGRTGHDGRFTVRGFKGEYRIAVSQGSKAVKVPAVISGTPDTVAVTLR